MAVTLGAEVTAAAQSSARIAEAVSARCGAARIDHKPCAGYQHACRAREFGQPPFRSRTIRRCQQRDASRRHLNRESAISRVLVTLLVGMLVAAPAAFADTSSLTLSPNVVTVGHVAVGSTVEQTVTLTNTGNEPLTLNSFEAFGFNGNFMVNPGSCTLGTTLAAGGSCTFSVVTSPSVTGAIRGQFCYTGAGATTSDRKCGRIVGAAS